MFIDTNEKKNYEEEEIFVYKVYEMHIISRRNLHKIIE